MGNPKLNSLAARKNKLGNTNNIKANSNAAHAAQQWQPAYGERTVPGVEDGAEKPPAPEVQTTYTDAKGDQPLDQTKVRIRVPTKYLYKYTGMKNELDVGNFGGIVFPYTPIISYDVKADYTSANPIHSNFSINFYQRSSVGPISISGKFSVENWYDAAVYISTLHILKSLTKMRSGGVGGDTDSGAPPPICRLEAYGDMMLKNVPVVITSFRVELPDSVDYFTTDAFGLVNSVPTMSTLAITCLPMYSRAEMQVFSVDKYVSGSYIGKGFI
jgi:hypothetical protein